LGAEARAVERNGFTFARMNSIRRIDPGPRMSEASVLGDRMYLSGMIPRTQRRTLPAR